MRVGHTTRDQVLKLLGMPYVASADGSALAYTWEVQQGVAVWPFCFMANTVDGYRTLVLRFDANGRLASYEVLKDDEQGVDFGSAYRPLPEDLRREQYNQRRGPTTLPLH